LAHLKSISSNGAPEVQINRILVAKHIEFRGEELKADFTWSQVFSGEIFKTAKSFALPLDLAPCQVICVINSSN
jgi:hypothetical protein